MSAPTAKARTTIDEEEQDRRLAISYSRLVMTRQALLNLANYKYKSGEYTPIDTFLNDKLWVPATEYLPMWLAPNAVTLIGWLCQALAALTSCWFAPEFGRDNGVPWYVCIYVAFSFFFYQTMDAMDGKQARRTGNSSPLGQMFDHGCDCMSTIFTTIGMCTVMRFNFGFRTTILIFSAQVIFFLGQWSEFNTHQFTHQINGFGVTEAQLMTIGIILLPVLFGSDFYRYAIPGTPFNLGHFFGTLAIGVCWAQAGFGIHKVLTTKDVDVKHALKQLMPIGFLTLTGLAWSWTPQNHPVITALALGTAFSNMTLRMIVSAMTHMEYPLLQRSFYPLPVLFTVNFLNLAPDHMDIMVGGYFAFVVYDCYLYITQTIEEICAHLEINCLTITPKKEEAKKN